VKEWKGNSLNFYISPHPQPANKYASTEILSANEGAPGGGETEEKNYVYIHTHTLTHTQSILNKDFRTWSPHTEMLQDLLALS